MQSIVKAAAIIIAATYGLAFLGCLLTGPLLQKIDEGELSWAYHWENLGTPGGGATEIANLDYKKNSAFWSSETIITVKTVETGRWTYDSQSRQWTVASTWPPASLACCLEEKDSGIDKNCPIYEATYMGTDLTLCDCFVAPNSGFPKDADYKDCATVITYVNDYGSDAWQAAVLDDGSVWVKHDASPSPQGENAAYRIEGIIITVIAGWILLALGWAIRKKNVTKSTLPPG